MDVLVQVAQTGDMTDQVFAIPLGYSVGIHPLDDSCEVRTVLASADYITVDRNVWWWSGVAAAGSNIWIRARIGRRVEIAIT